MSILRLIFFISSLFLLACGPDSIIVDQKVFDQQGARCSAFSRKYESFASFKGRAVYEYVPITIEQTSYLGSTKIKPVRYAQVVAVDHQKNIVQCSETDVNGHFHLDVPKNKNLEIRILSRIDNKKSNVAVSNLLAVNKSEVHYMSKDTYSDKSQHLGDFVAQARSGNFLGGAFFILDTILFSNEKLVEMLQLDALNHKLVNVFWKYGNSSVLTSYDFMRHHIYIQGGELDNGQLAGDPDHFDTSIIVHEYVHLVENVFGKPDSPAGTHVPGRNLDPRLSWSEGLAHFLQGVILNRPYYIDSKLSGYFLFHLENNFCSSLTSCELAELPGEGNFREIEVARYLWDLYDDHSFETDEDVQVSLKRIWNIITSKKDGFLDERFSFQSLGLFNYLLAKKVNFSAEMLEMQQMHKIAYGREAFAQYIDTGENCLSYKMHPKANRDREFDWVDNNDFYHYYHKGGPATFSLSYNSLIERGIESSLSLLIYKAPKAKIFVHSNFSLGHSVADPKEDILARTPASTDGDVRTAEVKFIEWNDLPKGHYLINVRAVSQQNPTAYEIAVNDEMLCPQDYPETL